MSEQDVIERLEVSVKKQSGLNDTELLDVAKHGASGGFSGFTYYRETVAFFDSNEDDIFELLEREADQDGSTILELLASFGGANTVTDVSTFKNLLAWFALEEVAYLIERRQEHLEQTESA